MCWYAFGQKSFTQTASSFDSLCVTFIRMINELASRASIRAIAITTRDDFESGMHLCCVFSFFFADFHVWSGGCPADGHDPGWAAGDGRPATAADRGPATTAGYQGRETQMALFPQISSASWTGCLEPRPFLVSQPAFPQFLGRIIIAPFTLEVNSCSIPFVPSCPCNVYNNDTPTVIIVRTSGLGRPAFFGSSCETIYLFSVKIWCKNCNGTHSMLV